MIVLNKDTTMEQSKMENTHKPTFEEMFRKEIDAYCAYKEWEEENDDPILDMALEEIMMDEYLHAKFLRDYMIEHNMYTLKDDDHHEKKFWKIQRKLFRE